MRIIVLLALLWIVIGSIPARAQISACPPYATPIKLNFVTDNAPTTYNNDFNVTGIQTVMRRRGHAIAGVHQRPLGLTSSQLGFSITGQTYATPVNAGYCVYLRSVEVKFGYRSMDVFIASEYRPQTCEYKTIMDHENQHVAINLGTLRLYAPRVRQELEQQLQLLQPRLTKNAQVSTDRKVSDLTKALDPLLNEMDRTMANRNAAIDSNVNYAALADLCKNWDQGNVWPVQPPAKAN